MTYTIDRFEDNGLVVLGTENRKRIDVPRAHVLAEAEEDDVLTPIPEAK